MFYISLFMVNFCYVLVNGVEGGISCKNYFNERVDWWVIYKPPGEGAAGRNFSFVSPEKYEDTKLRRWKTVLDISEISMLDFTLAPLYKKSLANSVALLNFEGSESTQPSTARGLLMASDSGGLYLGYTVPYLVDLTTEMPEFPDSEISTGHLIVCVSMDIPTLNNVGIYIKNAAPKVLSLKVPNSLMTKLTSWFYVHANSDDTTWSAKQPSAMEFNTGNISGMLMVRRPKQKHCIYQAFAKKQGVILDVYAPSQKKKKDLCEKDYGIRTIDSISLNVPGDDPYVQYANNSTDNAKFGVSTASKWQKRIPGEEQYWACFSGLGRDADSGQGGLLLCLYNYLLWNAMDSLKIKEPECPH